MNVHHAPSPRQRGPSPRCAGLGYTLFLCLTACSAAGDPQLSKLVSIRVAGFVEAAGIT